MDWKARVRAAFDPERVPDEEIIEELAEHASAAYQAALADGDSAAEAERRVSAQVEGWAANRQLLNRRPRRPPVLDAPPATTSRLVGLGHDVRCAVRQLRRQPGYSLLAIVTMALGVGATTALFSVAYGVLLKPLPWPDSDRLVRVYETRKGATNRFGPIMTNVSYLAWRDRPSTIDAVAAWSAGDATMEDGGEASRIRVAAATASLFQVLLAQPVLGALYSESDETPGGEPAAVISHGLWLERYGGSRDVLGRLVRIDGRAHRIVGVMPISFQFPDRDTRAWIPKPIPRVQDGLSMFSGIARLKAGVTAERAAAEATARSRSAPDPGLVVMAVFGTRTPIDVSVIPLLEAQTAEVRPAILVFLVAVGLLLATATANVASVQLARAAGRRREIAIRSALGAGGPRLVRQFVVESLMLGLAGGAAGLALAYGLDRALPWLLPANFPRAADITIDLRVMAFAAAVSLLTGLAFGAVPALQARRVNVNESLAEDGLAPVGGGTRSRAARGRALIMAGQMAIACVLLVDAALFTRSFIALVGADRGYDPSNILTARLPLPDATWTPQRRAAVLTTVLERLRQIPMVTNAAVTTALPLLPGESLMSFRMRSPQTGQTIEAQASLRVVSPAYFAALRLRVLQGRVFRDADTATTTPVVVVNRTFARRYLNDAPIGARLPVGSNVARPEAEVIGVVDDVHHRSVTDPPAPEIYESYRQLAGGLDHDEPTLVVRTTGDPMGLVPTLRGIVREQDAALALDSVRTMEERVQTSLAQPRLYAWLLGGFAVFALAIAGVGLFGVLGYAVAQRSREIGVRTALGARPLDIVALVVRQGFAIAAAGLAAGLFVSYVSAKSLSRLLYGVAANDTLSFTLVPLILLVVAALATAVPARRAANVDPARVLRG